MSAVLESDPSPDEESLWAPSVADFPQFQFSKREVKRSGELIAGALVWNDRTAPEIRQAFLVANNWRDAHAYPMRSIRRQLIWYMGNQNLEGITGARLK
jgi:hypothetical protein